MSCAPVSLVLLGEGEGGSSCVCGCETSPWAGGSRRPQGLVRGGRGRRGTWEEPAASPRPFFSVGRLATDPESRPGWLSLGLGGEGAAVPGALHVPSGQPALWLGSCVLWAPQGAELSPPPPPPPPAPGGLTWGPLRSCRQLLQPEVQPLGSTAVACGEPESRPSPAASCRVPRGCILGTPGRCRVLSDGWTDGSWDSTTSLWQVCLSRPASCRLPARVAPEHQAAGLGGKQQWANAFPPGSCAHARPGCHPSATWGHKALTGGGPRGPFSSTGGTHSPSEGGWRGGGAP